MVKSADARLARALLASLPTARRRLLLLRVVAGLAAQENRTGELGPLRPGPSRPQ